MANEFVIKRGIVFTTGEKISVEEGNITLSNTSSASNLTLTDSTSTVVFSNELVTIVNPVTASDWIKITVNGVNKVMRLYDYTS